MEHPIMERLHLGRIVPGMDVSDIGGERVGTVANVYRYDTLPDSSPSYGGMAGAAGDEIMEVKTGFLGLGRHLFVPLDAVQEVITDCVFLSKTKETFDEMGWYEKPAHFASLH